MTEAVATLPSTDEASTMEAMRSPDTRRMTMKQLFWFAGVVARGPLCPTNLRQMFQNGELDSRGVAESVFGMMMMGQEHGFSPLQSLKVYTVIKGQVALTAHGTNSLVLRSGKLATVSEPEYTGSVKEKDRACTIRCTRVGDPNEKSETFTFERAEKMGLLSSPKSNWWRQFDTMLEHRARGHLYRRVFADVLNGIYMDSEVESFQEAVILGSPAPSPAATRPVAAAGAAQSLPPAHTPPATAAAAPAPSQAAVPAASAVTPPPASATPPAVAREEAVSAKLVAFRAWLKATTTTAGLEDQELLKEAASFKGTPEYAAAKSLWAKRKSELEEEAAAKARQVVEEEAAVADDAWDAVDEQPTGDENIDAAMKWGPGANG